MPEMYVFQGCSKPISSVTIDEHTEKFTPNILPCRIHHDGPIESTDRFWIPQTDEKGTHHGITCGNIPLRIRIQCSDILFLQIRTKPHILEDAGYEVGVSRFPRPIKVRAEMLLRCDLVQLANTGFNND